MSAPKAPENILPPEVVTESDGSEKKYGDPNSNPLSQAIRKCLDAKAEREKYPVRKRPFFFQLPSLLAPKKKKAEYCQPGDVVGIQNTPPPKKKGVRQMLCTACGAKWRVLPPLSADPSLHVPPSPWHSFGPHVCFASRELDSLIPI